MIVLFCLSNLILASYSENQLLTSNLIDIASNKPYVTVSTVSGWPGNQTTLVHKSVMLT